MDQSRRDPAEWSLVRIPSRVSQPLRKRCLAAHQRAYARTKTRCDLPESLSHGFVGREQGNEEFFAKETSAEDRGSERRRG